MRQRLRAIPRGFWLCFLVATANACVWALVTPSFQVPDEIPHAGYAQYFAETGKVPRPLNTTAGLAQPSEEISYATGQVPFSYTGTPSWDPERDRFTEENFSPSMDRTYEAGAGAAANYPPLYYVLEAIPYRLASAADFYDRLMLMRLFSALFAGLTAGFCFLFVRELMPGSPWASLAAGLAVAFQPLMAFVSGGVNADALLYAASAALFFTVARAFRRGLTVRRGLAIGAALSVALLSKGTALGFAPAAAIAVGLLVWKASERRTALKGAAAAVVTGAVPFLLWLVAASAIYSRPTSATTSGLATAAGGHDLREQLSYAWQAFLPKLPFMNEAFPQGDVIRHVWFDGFVGRFGYAQYEFPTWVENVAVVFFVVLLALVVVALVRARRALLPRWAEIASYVLMAAAICGVVALAGFRLAPPPLEPVFQARYLLPLLALYGGLIALATRAGGRRWGPAIATLAVAIAATHNAAAIVLTVGRYYT